eukprot:gene4321-4574_t
MQLRSSTSLVALLQALQGKKLEFELRNDVNVTGKLASCDEYMNLFVDNAVWQPSQGPAKLYPFLFLKAQQLKKQRVAAALELINKPQQRLAKGQMASVAMDQVAEDGNSDG